jgi:dienelactone hydrolase
MAGNAALDHGYARSSFADDAGIRHDLYRAGSGPAVIVMHEIGGLNEAVVAVAERIRREGFSVVLPSFLSRAFGGASWLTNLAPACVFREFWAFALRYDRPVTRWLQALAAAEHARCGGPGVGIVGMCFSGGFALSAATRAPIVAAVASQPSLPFQWRPGAPRDLGMSAAAEDDLVARSRSGEVCVRAFRYDGDRVAPAARIERLKELLGTEVVVEPIPGNAHPVLDRAVGIGTRPAGTPDPNAVPALAETIRVLRMQLLGSPV